MLPEIKNIATFKQQRVAVAFLSKFKFSSLLPHLPRNNCPTRCMFLFVMIFCLRSGPKFSILLTHTLSSHLKFFSHTLIPISFDKFFPNLLLLRVFQNIVWLMVCLFFFCVSRRASSSHRNVSIYSTVIWDSVFPPSTLPPHFPAGVLNSIKNQA
uniref:(northern house mosquito) hypothetical protein n=1 Tax=Culex pipiens TaxID=7175 RepID=A0A8D8BZ98_CULPI